MNATLDTGAAETSGGAFYEIFEIGMIAGPSVEAVRAQFRAICDMTDAGGMVPHGVMAP